jgi:ATP-dependent RNA helicase DHX33
LIAVLAAFQTLAGLGALKGPTEITPLGSSMLAYPLDPVHARILLASFDAACPSEIIDILSLVVAGPVWIDRANDRDNIALARAKFIHRDGDHLTGMNVLRAYMAIRESKDVGVAKWCKDNFVNSKTLAHAVRIRDQLRELAVRQGRDPDSSCGTEWDRVGKCLLAGLFMNSAIITPDGTYRQTAGSLVSAMPHDGPDQMTNRTLASQDPPQLRPDEQEDPGDSVRRAGECPRHL